MSFEQRGRMPLDYGTAVLPGSPLRFRGPMPKTTEQSVVCIGGSETFGRFIPAPYPTLLNDMLPGPVLNLGVVNAGLDVVMYDPAITAAHSVADAVVLQVTCAHNMTNRFYSVHPRRNDRFLKASSMLRTIYPQVDFTEFHFTRHLLSHLNDLSQDRFDIIRAELTVSWVARMRRFIAQTSAPVHVLWLSNTNPSDMAASGLGVDPLFVTQSMLDEISDVAASVTVVGPASDQMVGEVAGKFFGPREEAAARLMPGPDAHERAARALLAQLG